MVIVRSIKAMALRECLLPGITEVDRYVQRVMESLQVYGGHFGASVRCFRALTVVNVQRSV
jgi:hypothetical protein